MDDVIGKCSAPSINIGLFIRLFTEIQKKGTLCQIYFFARLAWKWCIHLKTSPLTIKAGKSRPVLGTSIVIFIMPQLLWQLNLFWRFRPVFAGNRTTDPLHTWRTLYQLRHSDGFKAQIMMALPVNLFTSFVGYIFISEKIKRLWNWNCAYVMKDSVIERNRFIFWRDLQ